MVKRLFISLFAVSMTACSLAPGINLHEGQFDRIEGTEEAPPAVSLIPITPGLIQEQYRLALLSHKRGDSPAGSAGYQYLIGPQDVLNIIVWEHPELTIPAGGQRPVEQDGNRVRNDGTIFYPYVGVIEVAGKSAEQVREVLTARLSKFIKNPQLDVRIVSFNSQKVHVAGAVKTAGSVPITDMPLTLGDAINLGGGVNDKADLQEVILIRDGRNQVLNLQDLYHRGDVSQNVLLRDKDIVYVPVNTVRKVYVMGEVSNPAAMSMQDGELTLADVMATAGIDQQAADPERIFVLRQQQGGEAVAYHLNASEPAALILATTFSLEPLDVVFVSTAKLTRWNRVLSQLMPTVQTLWSLDRIVSP
jgi:polysaccharide export outer membrane protein